MLDVKEVSTGYGKTTVVHDVSFSVKTGERLAIIGPNGCGKSTLLRALANLLPYKGNVFYDGVEISKMKQKQSAKKVALLTQTTNVYFPFTVFEIVSFGRYSQNEDVLGRLTSEDKDEVLCAISQVGLLDEKDKLISQLSGGQFQRAFLAKAFAQDPEVLLLDEPTNHLDIKSQLDFLGQLDKWYEKGGKSVVSIMHDINIAAEFSEDVLLLCNGRSEFYGKMEKLMQCDTLHKVFEVDVRGMMQRAYSRWV